MLISGLPYVDRVVPTQFVVLDAFVFRKLVFHELFGLLDFLLLFLKLKNFLRILITQSLLLGKFLILEVRDIGQAFQLRDQHLSLGHRLALIFLSHLGMSRKLLLLG